MTRDEKYVQAFLVADEVLRRGVPSDPRGVVPIVSDDRMPEGMSALGTKSGSIVVSELA